jgi:hypothetical protein
MSILIKVYYSLLADIRKLTGIHLDLPEDLPMSWMLLEAPALDKQMLAYFEGRDSIPSFPEWLLPLWNHCLVNYNDAVALKCLRTLLVFGYKAEFEPTKDQLHEAQSAFEGANQGVAVWNSNFKSYDVCPAMFREARRLVGYVIGRADWSRIVPSHGPGAVFPRSDPCDKGQFDVYTPIEEYYPYDSNFNCVHNLGMDDLLSTRVTHDKIVCKMVAVPKDSRGPRLICVHPKESVWIQQGQRHTLEKLITTNSLTSGKINFTDQTINGKLALSSSSDREYCTLDLKEASDRIGIELVKYLFGAHASKYLCATRASHVKLLDGRLVELQMFAPMGNCLTFPVESLVFWSLVRAGILSKYGHNCTDVYVFGDDIIFPTRYFEGAINGLIRAGLIPNIGKTFKDGFFRESCGVDAYHGKDVTPLRCKVKGIFSYSDAESVCDLAKRLRIAGFCDTSAYLYSAVSRKFGRLSLTNNLDCQGLVEYVDYDFGKLLRYEDLVSFNKKTHVWQVPIRRRARTTEVFASHAWWHVQDSLLSLIRKDQGITTEHAFGEFRLIDSERGLQYPTPNGERLKRGMVDLIVHK